MRLIVLCQTHGCSFTPYKYINNHMLYNQKNSMLIITSTTPIIFSWAWGISFQHEASQKRLVTKQKSVLQVKMTAGIP